MRALQPNVLHWFRRMFHWNPQHFLERYQLQPLSPDLLTVKRHTLAVPSSARAPGGFRRLRTSVNVFAQIKKEMAFLFW